MASSRRLLLGRRFFVAGVVSPKWPASRPGRQFSKKSSADSERTESRLLLSQSSDSVQDESVSVSSSQELGSIEPDLYLRRNSVIHCDNADGVSNCGTVVCKLDYDFCTSDLLVTVQRATSLPDQQQKGFTDPFVSLQLEPPADARERRTAVQRKTQSPVYNETFKFPLEFEELPGRRLRLSVHDYDRFSRHAVVCQCQLQLGGVDVTAAPTLHCALAPCLLSQRQSGQLLLSLCLLPGAEKLTVVVMKAKNLACPAKAQSVDPYVRVLLQFADKQKKTKQKKRKTTAKRREPNPVWNEALQFTLPQAAAAGASLEISVLHRDARATKDAQIGCLRLGGGDDCATEGRRHWLETLANPRRSLAAWHSLIG